MATLLRANHLTKFYGSHRAVGDITLGIERGSLTAVIGPNGAGKSTTISMLIGISKPDGGTITYPDYERARQQTGTGRPTIGVVFQNSVLDPQLTVRENLACRARLYQSITEPKARVEKLIELVSLEPFADQRYSTLSGGQRRSVDIARALINDPDILVLDEPTTGLDITTRQALWDLLSRLREEARLSILLTTHYLEEAEHAEQVYVIDHGRVMASGSAEQLIGQYAQYQLSLVIKPGAQKQADAAINATLNQLVAPERIQRNVSEPTLDPAPMHTDTLSPVSAPTAASTTLPNLTHRNLTLPNADQSLTMLTALRPYLADFECRPGTMNDVFLALTCDPDR